VHALTVKLKLPDCPLMAESRRPHITAGPLFQAPSNASLWRLPRWRSIDPASSGCCRKQRLPSAVRLASYARIPANRQPSFFRMTTRPLLQPRRWKLPAWTSRMGSAAAKRATKWHEHAELGAFVRLLSRSINPKLDEQEVHYRTRYIHRLLMDDACRKHADAEGVRAS
jgi:hypothetical protein